MNFEKIESIGKKIFAKFPKTRRFLKGIYQRVMFLISKDKIKCEGSLHKISPDDNYEYFFGYYDKSPWDNSDRYMISLKVKNAHKTPDSIEEAQIVVFDTKNNNKMEVVGTTHCWNTQQGCMAQWLGPDFSTKIIYNDFRNGKYVSVIYNFKTKKEEKILEMPIYDVAKDGSFALTLDFSRLHRLRKGYGYANKEETTKKEICPDKTCVWKIDLKTGKITDVIKYTDLANFEKRKEMINATHKVNHIMISPNSERFMILHRWFKNNEKFTRLVTMDINGENMYNLSDDNFVSHCCWKNDKEILSFLRKKDFGDHYYLMKDKTKEYKILWPQLNTDGHCTYSPDKKYVITDTYPNNKRIASIYLCTETGEPIKLARVFSPFKYDNDTRCDLHPRWNHNGNEVCIDSVHENKKGLYTLKITDNCLESPKKQKLNNNINIEKLKEKIKKYDFVSFDIFDTLIKRDVPTPDSVFTLVRRRYERITNQELANFEEERKKAEILARSKNEFDEITLDNIYENLYINQSKIDKDLIKKIEIEIETMVCVVNKPLLDIYNYCIKTGKKVLIISNMYLPQKNIEKILSNAGYENYKKLYLSCTYKAKKSDGKLFKIVLKEEKIKPSQLIHIGDSWKADYIQPSKLGIKSIHISKHIDNLFHSNFPIETVDEFDLSCIKAFVNNHISLEQNEYYRYGYEAFGILLLGFNKWLIDELEKKNIKDIFFFSRDGFVIKRAFDIQNKNKKINSHYFYVSRRSLRVPQLWLNSDYEQVINVFPLAKFLTVETFINNLGLNPLDYEQQLKKVGLSKDTVLSKNELYNNKIMKKFYESIKNDVISHSKEEFNIFLDYMKQNNFQGNIAVVDIGWHGSLQFFIQQIVDKLNLNLTMHGYYIGLATEAKRQIDINGYVVDKDSKTNSCDAWKPYNGLVESLFLAQEGSTEKFKRLSNGTVQPVLFPYEYENEKGEKEEEAIKVKNIQNGAIDFVKDIVDSGLEEYLDYTSTSAFSNINQTGIHPTKKDLELFSNFRFLEEQIDYLAKPKKLFFYLIHPQQFKKDFSFSRWKIGFMKKIFIIPLPYKKMYKILRNLSNKK